MNWEEELRKWIQNSKDAKLFFESDGEEAFKEALKNKIQELHEQEKDEQKQQPIHIKETDLKKNHRNLLQKSNWYDENY